MSTVIRGTEATGRDLIPGAYEPRPSRLRQPGGMSGPAAGSAELPGVTSSMDAATIVEHRREGGRLKHQKGDL